MCCDLLLIVGIFPGQKTAVTGEEGQRLGWQLVGEESGGQKGNVKSECEYFS